MLSLLKKPIILLLLLLTIGGGVYFFQKKNGKILGENTVLDNYLETNFPQVNNLIEKLPFSSKLLDEATPSAEETSTSKLQSTLNLTGQQLETLAENGTKVKDQLNDFISQIKESSQSTPLHEKALEYGQYLYCQQVIKEYEN